MNKAELCEMFVVVPACCRFAPFWMATTSHQFCSRYTYIYIWQKSGFLQTGNLVVPQVPEEGCGIWANTASLNGNRNN